MSALELFRKLQVTVASRPTFKTHRYTARGLLRNLIYDHVNVFRQKSDPVRIIQAYRSLNNPNYFGGPTYA